MSALPIDLGMIREILGEGDLMPKKRYLDPKLEIRKDVKRPFYFVRAVVPVNRGEGKIGKRLPHFIGYVDELTRKKAEEERRKYLAMVNGGAFLVKAQIRFGDIVKRFVDVRLPELGAATRARYQTLIDVHILPEFQNARLCDIDREHIERWLSAKAQPREIHGKEVSGLGWWSRVGLKGVMQSIYSAAKDWKIWEAESPCVGVRIGKKREVREKRILSKDHLQQLIAALDKDTRFMVMIGFATGLRISEILGLKWQDVNLTEGAITVRRRWHRGDVDEPKTPESRRVRQLGPLVEDFRAIYPGPHKSEQFVFSGQDGRPPDDRDVLRERLRPTARAIGAYFPGFGFHTFRRQNVSWRQEAGATPIEAMKAAGHTKMDTTVLYTITDAERERGHVQKMMDRLMQMPEGPKQ